MSTTQASYLTDEEVLDEARNWLEDCFSDLPEDLSDAEVRAGVQRHYVGGWAQFVADVA